MTLPFWKYHGLGNDFVLVEGRQPMAPAQAVDLCDRRRGVGADGVLTILPARAKGAAAFMHIYNSDGSVAAMCGNGIRCVARHLVEHRGNPGDLDIETDAGVKHCRVNRAPGGAVESVAVDMGPGHYLAEQELAIGGEKLVLHRVSMGNPHAVVFGDGWRGKAERLGPLLSVAFPGGVNAGFAALRDGGIDLVVWERGAGLTEACGTGACAAALAAVKKGIVRPGPVEVRLPGGALLVTVGPDLSAVVMRGPAELVFEGVYKAA